MTKIPFTIRAEEDEIEFWKKNAGKNLSEWIRKTLNNAAAGAKDAKVLTGYFCGTFDGRFVQAAPEETKIVENLEPATPLDFSLAPRLAGTPKTPETLPANDAVKKKLKTCIHNTPRGHHCGLCGGKAKVK